MMDTKTLGEYGERVACEYLVEKGFKILGRNWRINFGEIDIVARRKRRFFARADKTIHFVEVKTIVAAPGFFPEDRVDAAKQHKLRQLAQIWLNQHKFKENHPYQIDVVGVIIDSVGSHHISYFPNGVPGN